MLRRPKAFELAIHHNSNLGTQSFSLLHRMSSQDDCTLLAKSWNVWNYCPHESFSLRVDSCWGLIKKNDGRITYQSDCALELSFVSTWKLSCLGVNVLCQVHLFDLLGYQLISIVFLDTFDPSIEIKMLLDGQCIEERIKLWTIAHKTPSLVISLRSLHIMTPHVKFPSVWSFLSSQTLKSGCLPCTCDSQQCETFPGFQAKVKIGYSFRFKVVTLGQLSNWDRTLFRFKLFDPFLFKNWIVIFNVFKCN